MVEYIVFYDREGEDPFWSVKCEDSTTILQNMHLEEGITTEVYTEKEFKEL